MSIPAQTIEGFYIPETLYYSGDFEITNHRTQQAVYNKHSIGAQYSCAGVQNPSYPLGWAISASSNSFIVENDKGATLALSTFTYQGRTVYYYFAYVGASYPSQYPVSITPEPDNDYGKNAVREGYISWLMVYGGYSPDEGFNITYDLENCTGGVDNPTVIPPNATTTLANFTPDESFEFVSASCWIDGDGFPSGTPVYFVWEPETGGLRIGPVTSDITVHVHAYGDPYADGGYSGQGGGGGGQNFASTPIGRAPLPTLSFADTGLCRIYNPTLAQLQALANYMWTDDSFLQTVINHAKQLLEDPIEAIISLSLVPVPVPNRTAEEVKVLFIPTGISMPPVANQFVEVDCGTLSLPVEDQYGAALDFNPYTKIDLYLPYIGQVSIDVDEVMYKTMHCVYRVDVVTGMCVAVISVGTGTNETVLYQFAGHCGVQMPLNSADFSSWVGAIVTAAKTIGGLAAAGAGGGGAAAALIGGPTPVTSKTTRTTQGGGHHFQSSQTGRNPSTGRQITMGTMTADRVNLPEVTTSVHETTPASFGELAARGAANTVDAIIGSKMHFEHAGSFSGNSGYIAGVRRPYAILKRPRQCYPENYASYRGFPAMIYMNLGNCTGYTEVHDIHLTGISATNPELGELAQLLKTGVIL